ncbi:MAG: hypothetical protein ACK4TA_00970 [Saprospiraceae bacterium]
MPYTTTLSLLSLCIIHYNVLFAQNDNILITKNFKFNDGIYLTLQDLQKNQPNFSWNQVVANLASSDEGFIVQVESIKTEEQTLDLQQVWGICIKGMPYVRLPKEESNSTATIFAGLRVRGKISYFSYDAVIKEMQEIKAYNPLTGRPFRTAKLPVEKQVIREKILDFNTGQIADFNKANFLSWIENDRQLWNTVRDFTEKDVEEKLFKCLLIYVDRNEIYLK